MQRMNNNLVLAASQQPDVMNALARGTQAAGMANEVQDSNALRSFMQQNGAGVMAGDQNALAGLAQVGPQGAQMAMQAQDRQREYAMQQERLQMARAAGARAAATAAQQASAQQLAAERDEIAKGLAAVYPSIESGNLERVQATFSQFGLEPPETLEDAQMTIAQFEGAVEVIDRYKGMQPQQDGFRPATPEEAAQYGAQAGQIDQGSGRFYPNNPPKGMEITSDGLGGFTLREGPGVGAQDGRPAPSDPNLMISSIDGILNDPALDMSTGMLSPLQNIPGTPQRRVGARIDQLNGQAFLQAFESLKGGGQITEVEGTKATQAIGRLDSAQSPADYRAALTELRSLLAEAATRPEGWVDSAQRRQVQPFSAADANAMTPEQILSMGPGALTRFPVSQLDWTDAQWDALEALAAQEQAQRGAR